MIDFTKLMRTGINAMTDNAPAILTAFGAVGVVGTAVLTAKASFQASDRIREAKLEKAMAMGRVDEPVVLTKMELTQLVAPLYVGAVTTGVLSCGAIIMSHRISSKRAAVLAAAYAMNEKRLEEYQEKIKEKLGVKKEKEARDEIIQEKINRDYDEGAVIFSPTDGKVLIREEYTGRTFWSSIDEINKAVNEINAEINMSGAARMSDFYDAIGLPHVSVSDYFGWTHNERLDLEWNTSTTPDGKTPIHTFEYTNHPVMNPEREAHPFR